MHPDDNAPLSPLRRVWGVVRVLAGIAIVAGVAAQFIRTIQTASENDRDIVTTVVNFFSFFTILSNCLGAILLIIGGMWLLTRGRSHRFEPRALSYAFVSVGTYMVVTGIVYNTLLRNVALDQGTTVAWSNEVLHVAGPVVFLLELILCIARRALPWKAMGIAVIFPIAWAVYTLSRGEFVVHPITGAHHWYPYPFLDPYLVPNGYFGVAIYVVGIAAVVMGVAALAVWRTRIGSHNASDSTPLEISEPLEGSEVSVAVSRKDSVPFENSEPLNTSEADTRG